GYADWGLAGEIRLAEQLVHGDLRIAQGEQPLREIVQSQTCCAETFGERAENRRQIVFVRQAVVAGEPEIGAAQLFVIFEVGGSSIFSPVTNSRRENAGHEKRMVSDVRADEKACVVIHLLEGGDH